MPDQRQMRVLIVEDEALIVMDMESMIEDAGQLVVGVARSPCELSALEPDMPPDLALVDMQLARGGTGLEAADIIRERWSNTVIVFVTANAAKIPEGFGGAHGAIPKPFSRTGFAAAMLYLNEGIIDPPPKIAMPASFIPAPFLSEVWPRPS